MIVDSRGDPINTTVSGGSSTLRFRYDAAQIGNRDDDHWLLADGLSAAAANDPAVRQRIRERARYEVSNNPFAKAAVDSFVLSVLSGCGPVLNCLHDDAEVSSTVESAWRRWYRASGIAQTLQTARRSQTVDGEVFAIVSSNPALQGQVKLSVRLIETEQVAAPWTSTDQAESDGIRFDEYGNPTHYYVLRHHPGSLYGYTGDQQGTWLPADRVCHLFAAYRPGQTRGVSEIVSSLLLFGDLRRYRSATVAAAEIAASVSLWLKSQVQAGGSPLTPGDSMAIRHGEMGVLPPGVEIEQLRSEIPTTTYNDFQRSLIVEAGRALNLPRGAGLGDWSDYNFSSARLELLDFQKILDANRDQLERQFLDVLYRLWLEEAVMVGEVPLDAVEAEYTWAWQGLPYSDPAKESTAETIRLAANTTTLAEIYGRQGKDYESALRQRAKEKALLKELGLTDSDVSGPDEEEEDNDE